MNFIQALRLALARVANWVNLEITRSTKGFKHWCQTEINTSEQNVRSDLASRIDSLGETLITDYVRNNELNSKCQDLGYKNGTQVVNMIDNYVNGKGFTVTIQYTYNWTPVYISKTLPQSADDYDVILPKTQEMYDYTDQPIKTVVLEDVKRLHFWDEANGLCVSDSNGNYIIYNYYYDYSGFNSSVWDEDAESHIPALDKNNFVVTEDMTVTVSHIYD